MENTFNLAQLLKNCPKGMELDSPIWDGVVFDHINMKSDYPIYIKKLGGLKESLTKDSCFDSDPGAKCVIFPKGKTTWEGFVPPQQFKDGDVLVHTQNQKFVMSIYHKRRTELIIKTHCILWDEDEGLSVGGEIYCYADQVRLANEKEKQKLFDTIRDNGYKWNAETKKLERLIDLKIEEGVETTPVNIDETQHKVGSKFDITSLKPFDKVLVRNYTSQKWTAALWSFYNNDEARYPYEVVGDKNYRCAIPYECNEHLLGSKEDCNEYFKTWED